MVEQQSLKYTLAPLLNSLLRELGESSYISVDKENSTLFIKNKKDEVLSIKLLYQSLLGKHEYTDNHELNGRAINLQDSLNWIINFSCEALDQDNQEEIQEFKKRVGESQRNIEKVLNDLGPSIEVSYKKELDFIGAESLLVLGHSFHPYPKAREGFSDKDFELYSPEYNKPFSLAWAIVDENIMTLKHQKYFNPMWMESIAEKCLEKELFLSLKKEKKKIIPVHPWQLSILSQKPHIKELMKQGKLYFIHEDSNIKWYSTSSIRSIYSLDCEYMLKFSMTLRLTNSIRHLQEVEVERGIQVYNVTQTSAGKKLALKWPNFEILHEPAFASLKRESGDITVDSIVSCRINPFTKGEEKNAFVLATINQVSPNGLSLLEKYSSKENLDYFTNWYKEFTKVIITPLLDAQANFGIFFGAHQQNIIIKLDNKGNPIKLYFRDCQGTGYSQEAFKLYGKEFKGLSLENGNILSKELGQKIFCYYLIVNTAFDTISHLAKLCGKHESIFIKILRDSIKDLKEKGVKDSSCIDYLLEADYIWAKGNYKCSLKGINENTMNSPSDIYVPIRNPIMERV